MLNSALVMLCWRWQEGSRQWGISKPRGEDRPKVRIIYIDMTDKAPGKK